MADLVNNPDAKLVPDDEKSDDIEITTDPKVLAKRGITVQQVPLTDAAIAEKMANLGIVFAEPPSATRQVGARSLLNEDVRSILEANPDRFLLIAQDASITNLTALRRRNPQFEIRTRRSDKHRKNRGEIYARFLSSAGAEVAAQQREADLRETQEGARAAALEDVNERLREALATPESTEEDVAHLMEEKSRIETYDFGTGTTIERPSAPVLDGPTEPEPVVPVFKPTPEPDSEAPEAAPVVGATRSTVVL